MLDGFQIRLATVADVDLISSHRARMFRDMGELPPELFDSFSCSVVGDTSTNV